jgi:hypothetical protein
MLEDFSELTRRASELGNHHRKYLQTIVATKDLLVKRLEESGRIDEVHLWSAAADVAAEIECVGAMGRSLDERLQFLGCYFAFQLLHLNLRAVDVLRMGLSSRVDRFRLYRDFMLQMGTDLRRLTACYMEQLLDLFLPLDQRPEFVICGVGTRADQDDLDLGIVDDGSERRAAFNLAIGRMQREMLRRAIPLHLYLSEHVGDQSFSASIAEYRTLLDREIQDFVIITEMIGARFILGSRELFARFTREVTDRYSFHPRGDNRYHEGYLRGMLGEVRTLLLWELKNDRVNPKQDALRIIKGILYAQKTVLGISEVNAWDVLRRLAARDPGHRHVYEVLDRALSFIEVFRFLYQLVEVQEEEIFLADEGSRAQLESVAELMGYRDVGVVRAWDHLLIHYHEQVQAAREMADLLIADLRLHLERISVFSGLLARRREAPGEPRGEANLAVEFVTTLRFFRGTKYWDDVLGPMEAEDGLLLRQFVEHFEALPAEQRAIWVQRYAKWGEVTILALVRLLVLLHLRRGTVGSLQLFRDLSAAFVDRISRLPDVIHRLTAVFHHYPQLTNDFLASLERPDLRRLMGVLEGPVWSEEGEVLRRQLLEFCRLHDASSHYFRRFLRRIVERYPEHILLLDRPRRLEVVAKGVFARVANRRTYEEKKEEIGDYYDLEFLRVGLECLGGAPAEQVDAEFTVFSDNYLQALFDLCKQEVREEWKGRVHTRDLLAVYSTGGHGRKLAFDDDFDLVVLLNSDEPRIRRYCSRIVTRMNREIVRRGTMPHYRFIDHFGEYVTTFSELRGLLETPRDDLFIDMAQLLSARQIVGSKSFEEELQAAIVRPLILAHKEQFMRQVAGEIRSRHWAVEEGAIPPLDLKETRGGLRDIELVLLILIAKCDLVHPVCHEVLEPLVERLPQFESRLRKLLKACRFLKQRRDLYRLTVAAEDELLAEEVGPMARILGYCRDPDDALGRKRLISELRATTAEVAATVDSILAEVGV